MDIMSRVQSDGSEQNQGSVTAAVDQNSLQDSVMMDEAAIAAIHAAKMLNASLLLADHERAYVNLKAEYDTLLSSFNQQHATLAASCENISQLQEKIVSLNEELTTQRENAIRETRRSKNWEDKDRDSQERFARMEVEADSLRQEVSRLSASNNALNIQLVDIQTKSSLNSSSNAPLQYENLRLRSELDALSAHVSWMESELSARTSQLSLVRSTEATNYLSVSNELHSVKSKHEELTASNENLKIKYTSALKRLDSLQKQLMETEKNHSDEIHHLNSELTTERRLVALTKEQAARMEDRYNNVVRDMESMKMLAVAADQDHAIELTRLKEFMEKELQNSLEELKHNSEIEIEELKSELGRVRAEKLKLEDDLIHRSENMKTSPVTDSIQHHWVLEEGGKTDLNDEASVPSGPLSLVALYDRLAAKEDELRSERLDRQRLELYLERIQKDIEMKAPIMRQQRKEYEKALSQKKDLQLRLHEVVEDSRVLRETLRDKERESKQTEKECSELRLENADLATQVQTLLRRIIGDESSADERNNDLLCFVSVDELQTQNQRLLREHHRLVKNLSDLESQLSNDTSQMKIRQAESELNQLREEREHQEVLISGIVQQRDLYRALLLKTDAQILAAAGGEIDVGLDKGQTHIQQQKQELESTIAKLNADLISANNARVGLEERLVRIDAYSESLSLSNAKLQRDLSAAHAAAARSDAESSYCKQKLERVEDDLVNTKAELTRVVESRKEFMRINDDLQADLIALKNQVSKSEQELSHNEAKLRLSDAQVKTAQATELRLTNEINSLRLELARQESFIESMQRIETALSSRANESRTQLEDEIKRLNDLMSVERSQHQLTVENFLNKISSLEAQVESLQMRREEALSAVTALNKLVSELTDREAVLKKQYDDSQAALNKANVRLGNIEPDSTNGDKFEMITNELNALKDALTASKKKCDDYQIIAQSAEKSLLELSNVSSDYKLHTENEIVRLKEQIEMLNRTVQLKQEALDEIAKDLSVSREAQENTLHELQTKLNQVDLERQSLKDAEICYKDRVGAILFELESSKADARSAKDNYERELALHCAALNEARSTRRELEILMSKCVALERENENMKTVQLSEAEKIAAENLELQALVNNLQAQALEARNLNSLLNSQLSSVSKALLQLENERDSKGGIQESAMEGRGIESNQQIHELQEIINLMRSERDMLESQLSLARRAAEREKSAADVAKRALEAARVELDVAVSRQLRDDTTVAFTELSSKLKTYDEQMKTIRESNQLLRDEIEKLNEQLRIARQEKCSAVDALEPIEKERQSLEIQKGALEAEKLSLIREIDAWKERVQSLVTKFHQIDPQEHANALAQMEEAQKQLLILQSAKESVEKESASAKSLVSRLNKEVSKMKSQVESLTGKLDLVTSEKDSLAKTGSELQLVAKERDELKTAKEIVESELESAKIENEGNKSRIENLTTFLRKTKASVAELTTKLQQASQAEQEAKRSLAKEMDAHKLVLGELETLKMSNLTTETAVVKFPTQGSLITGSLEASNTVEDISTLSTGKDLPQVPSEGFHFSPSPVQEHIVLATLDKAPLSLSDSDNKGVIAVAASDTSRQSTDTNLELVAGIRQDTSDNSIETKVSDSNTVSREENSVTENPSTVNESLSVSVPSDENTIKEKLLKRKRDKKVQALVSTVIEPPGSANETTEVQTDAFSTVPPSTFTNKSNISEDLKEDGPKNVEGILESRNQHQLNCVPETERAHEPTLEPPRSVEFTGVEQNDFVTEVNSSQNRASEKSSDSSLNIHPDSKQGLIEGVCSTSAETFISDDISSQSEPSKKRILVDENTEMVSNKLPRLNQSSEDEKESSHMDVLCTDDKDTSLLLP